MPPIGVSCCVFRRRCEIYRGHLCVDSVGHICDYVEGNLCGKLYDVMMDTVSIYLQFTVDIVVVEQVDLQGIMESSTHH